MGKPRKKKEKKDKRNFRARKRKPFLDEVTVIDYKDIRLLRGS